MSTEIINVLNYICEKLGIAIDFTAENVMPQVMDILSRYRLLKITEIGIWCFIFVILAIVFVRFGKSFVSNYKLCNTSKEENYWWAYSTYFGEVQPKPISIIYVVCLVSYIMIAVITSDIGDFLKWILVPEIKYLELLKSYVQ